MMQHCFYNLCYISNYTFVASARIYEILNVNAFGAELKRGWHISIYIYINKVPSITELQGNWKKNYSVKIRNSTLKQFLHPDQNLFAFHTPYIPTDPVQFEFENSRDRNHYRHISSVHKTYRQIRNSDVQELTNMNCKRLRCYIVVDATLLQTKGHVRRNA